MTDQVLIVVNPVCGNQQAVIDVAAFVLPLLKGVDYRLCTTEGPKHAGTLAKEFIQSGEGRTVLIAGGDGTIHEVVNSLVMAESSKVVLIVWPSGTANALYASLYPTVALSPAHHDLLPHGTDDQTAYKMKSLLAFLHCWRFPESTMTSRSLSLARTVITNAEKNPIHTLVSIVVASASLHASILHTAEQLRAEIPGLDRFKEAARRNILNWSDSEVKIFGLDGETKNGVQLYDPSTDALRPLTDDALVDDGAPLHLTGPFAYFLSTVNVDRLEPTFTISSLFTTHPPPRGETTMDIVVLRPARDPEVGQSTAGYSTEIKMKFAQSVAMNVLHAAYDKGAHVGLRYDDRNGQGEPIIEYYRAGGWEWTPLSEETSSRLICADGTVVEIPIGGKAVCKVIHDESTPGFTVWV